MALDESDRELMRVVSRYLRRVEEVAAQDVQSFRTPFGELLCEHVGADVAALPVVSEEIAPHRLVDADIALDELAGGAPGSLVGVTGGEQRFHCALSELVDNAHTRFAPGAVSYAEHATSHDTTRRVVSFGARLFRFESVPVVVVQRAAAPRYGRESASLEIVATEPEVVSSLLDRLRALMIERSVLRGKVLSFVPTEFGHHAGATFLPRPDVPAEDIVLAEGVLDTVVAHVVGIGEQRQVLLDAGQHLKRGLLLYGPPGTGKTLTVRHLLSRMHGATSIVLTGSSIRYIGSAAEIARTFAPALVVLEDIDLVAMERSDSPQPLLFEVLDALDGLDGDADVAFVMTTNRVQVLERALAARPGRVDLGVEIPLPATEARRRLFRRYAGTLPLSDEALDAAADAADGTTGSFAKELMRRTVLGAALRGAAPDDDDLAQALAALLSSGEALTRLLLGSGRPESAEESAAPVDGSFDGIGSFDGTATFDGTAAYVGAASYGGTVSAGWSGGPDAGGPTGDPGAGLPSDDEPPAESQR